MIVNLDDVRTRCALAAGTETPLLTLFATAVHARFDLELNRKLERAEAHVQEFPAGMDFVLADRYPVETITKVEQLNDGVWTETLGLSTELRGRASVIDLKDWRATEAGLARITYNGGYVFPGAVPPAGAQILPKIIEMCAVEQISFMYQRKNSINVSRVEDSTGVYVEISDSYWVPWVRNMLRKYKRLTLI